MKKSVKVALATGALGVAGAVFLVGSSYADRGGFGPGFGGMMGGPGHGGPIVREMLASVDTNGDGALSQDEINEAINVRFTTFDANHDGSLSLDEYEALWADITRPLAVRTFQFLDPNGDAAVSKAEVEDRFGSVVAHMDRNGDGMLSEADRPHHRGGPRHHGHGPGHHGPRVPRWDREGPQDQ
jgi:Ca2+-binding EF-hand superfamily protein